MTDENTIDNGTDELAAIFEECQNDGLSKDETIITLVNRGGLDVTSAVRKYQSLAKGAGLILSTKDRTEKVNERLDELDLLNTEVRSETIHEIADTYDVSTATAAAHIRNYAEANGIELPSQNKNSLADMVAFVENLLNEEKTGPEIKQALQDEMGYSKNSAASAYSRATRELGISTGRTGASVPIDQLVSLMRENEGLPRKDMTKLIHETLGYSESTAGSFVTYTNFAKEWARQEAA